MCLNNVLGKAFFAYVFLPLPCFLCIKMRFRTFQILFYALRPGLVRAQKLTGWHFFNIIAQLVLDYALVQYFGVSTLLYLLFSSFFAWSLHPCAGHFIAEHYLWDGLEQETYSYYGTLNILAYNVGYHNEHHDFPSVPWTKLPALKKLAPEFYDTLPSHPSWPMVIINFILDKEVGIFARAKRRNKGSTVPILSLDRVELWFRIRIKISDYYLSDFYMVSEDHIRDLGVYHLCPNYPRRKRIESKVSSPKLEYCSRVYSTGRIRLSLRSSFPSVLFFALMECLYFLPPRPGSMRWLQPKTSSEVRNTRFEEEEAR